MKRNRSTRNLRLFWQLILAFVVTMSVIAAGFYLSGLAAFRRVQDELERQEAPQVALWAERLARYYGDHDGWDGLEGLLGSYPTGEGWAPWADGWAPPYLLADAEGTIIAASEAARVGGTLLGIERALAVPIAVDGSDIGYLHMPIVVFPIAASIGAPGEASTRGLRQYDFLRSALERLLLTEAVVVAVALALGAFLARRISRPVMSFTDATRAIAAGDLSVRVGEGYPGEIGELASSFNKMTEALERSDNLRRNMTVDVAHELRTPLTVIRGKLEGILDGVYPATEAHLAPILEETALLTRLVEDLRLLALAEARQLTLDLRPTDVSDLLHDLQVSFGPMAGDQGVAISLDLPQVLPTVPADWQRISQVVGNLISNALRHTGPGGSVVLSAERVDPGVQIAVQDTGSGIAPEDLPHVFERFWRGERSRSRDTGGSGLGLAIARELVGLHGGTISVESEIGEGSTFRIALPVHPAA